MNKQSIINYNKRNIYTAKSKNNYGFSCFARKNFIVGGNVIKGFGKIIDHQTGHYSIQMGAKKHFLPTKWTGRYLNHSCQPNTFIKTRPDGFPDLIALRTISKGEEITYSYWMTEYEWTKGVAENTLKCRCHTSHCIGQIKSFSQLSAKERNKFIKSNFISKYLRRLIFSRY